MSASHNQGPTVEGQNLDPWGQPVNDPWGTPPPSRRDRHRQTPDTGSRPGTSPAPGAATGSLGSPLEHDRRRLSRVKATGGSVTRTLAALFGGRHPATIAGEQAASVQIPVTTGRRIAVVSTRGGAGKSTAAALLAGVYSALRPDSTCVLDMDPGHGSLALRLGLENAPALDAIVPELTGGAQPGASHLAEMLAQASDGLYATGARAAAPTRSSGAELRQATSTISRYFPITLLDCPTGLDQADTQAALADCHGAVFIVPANLSGMDNALAALATWQTWPAVAAIPLTVLVMQQDRSSALDALDQAGRLSRLGFDAHAIGYDRHLAAGAAISPSLLLPAHREAAIALAGRILSRANEVR
ncbi:hypothetical protein [Arthrobacter sp.]|uniref:nucleotide-binding protein n=1 Tax=Arthrobacter sp. TaxID=1667 RepID=UPI003A9439B6